MTAPFVPADGERSRWQHAYDLVLSKKPGDDVTLYELGDLVGLDHHDYDARQALRGIMLEAKRHLELDGQQTVRTVRRFGWVVLSNAEHLNEIEKRRLKSARANDRAARLHNATNRAELSPNEQQRYDTEGRSILAAASLFNRKRKSFAELERRARAPRELPSFDN